MDPVVVALVLGAALLHATWNALVKSDGDPWVALALTNAAVALFALPLVVLWPLPDARAWPFLVASVILHQAYNAMLAASYQLGDLSRMYPVARGTAPPLVAVGGAVFAGESLSPGGWLAVAAVAVGLSSLGHRGQSGRALGFALGTGACIGAYTVVDGLGVRVSNAELGYIGWLFVLEAIPFGAFVVATRARRCLRTATLRWRRIGAGGLCAAIAYGVVIGAMARAPLAPVSALRETSVIMAAMLGVWLFREPFGRRRIAASSLVAAGVVLLQWAAAG